jgi:diacylglycerol kinase family enzyme
MTSLGAASGPHVRHFINVAGFGFSGSVISALEGRGGTLFDRYVPTLKAIGGPIAYFGATLRALFDWHNVDIQLSIDGVELPARRVTSVAIGNGRYYGGGMMICPEARLDSGHFDITILGDLKRFEVVRLARTIYDGTHVRNPAVTTLRATRIDACTTSDRPVLIELDGELSGQLPASFELVPSAIRLQVP